VVTQTRVDQESDHLPRCCSHVSRPAWAWFPSPGSTTPVILRLLVLSRRPETGCLDVEGQVSANVSRNRHTTLLPNVERARVSFAEPECCAAGACIGPRLHLPDALPYTDRSAMRQSWHDVRWCHDGRAGREQSQQTCVTFAPSHEAKSSRRFHLPTSAFPPTTRGLSHSSVGEQRGQSDERPRRRLG
jgi:hypothetical protein